MIAVDKSARGESESIVFDPKGAWPTRASVLAALNTGPLPQWIERLADGEGHNCPDEHAHLPTDARSSSGEVLLTAPGLTPDRVTSARRSAQTVEPTGSAKKPRLAGGIRQEVSSGQPSSTQPASRGSAAVQGMVSMVEYYPLAIIVQFKPLAVRKAVRGVPAVATADHGDTCRPHHLSVPKPCDIEKDAPNLSPALRTTPPSTNAAGVCPSIHCPSPDARI